LYSNLKGGNIVGYGAPVAFDRGVSRGAAVGIIAIAILILITLGVIF